MDDEYRKGCGGRRQLDILMIQSYREQAITVPMGARWKRRGFRINKLDDPNELEESQSHHQPIIIVPS